MASAAQRGVQFQGARGTRAERPEHATHRAVVHAALQLAHGHHPGIHPGRPERNEGRQRGRSGPMCLGHAGALDRRQMDMWAAYSAAGGLIGLAVGDRDWLKSSQEV